VGRSRSRRALGPAAALICCLVLLSGCGGSGQKGWARYDTAPDVGASIRSANCADWEKGTPDQRRGTVTRLRKFAGGPVGSSASIKRGPVLSDERAYDLLQSYCANRFARGFKLYKLYERAAAFLGH
jgi:hypothetical protein